MSAHIKRPTEAQMRYETQSLLYHGRMPSRGRSDLAGPVMAVLAILCVVACAADAVSRMFTTLPLFH
jgi:hypothetical protein